jgi:hypothetical protein
VRHDPPVTPVQKFLADNLERLLKRYYEGPAPPSRYGQEAAAFVLAAERNDGEWLAFATYLAEKAYQEGYIRGLEHAERMPTLPHEIAEDEMRHEWAWVPPVPMNITDEERASLEAMYSEQIQLLENEPPVGVLVDGLEDEDDA